MYEPRNTGSLSLSLSVSLSLSLQSTISRSEGDSKRGRQIYSRNIPRQRISWRVELFYWALNGHVSGKNWRGDMRTRSSWVLHDREKSHRQINLTHHSPVRHPSIQNDICMPARWRTPLYFICSIWCSSDQNTESHPPWARASAEAPVWRQGSRQGEGKARYAAGCAVEERYDRKALHNNTQGWV